MTRNPLTYKDAGVDIDAGNELVDRDVPVGAMLRLVMQDTGQEGMNRKVTATDSVVETSVHCDLVPHILQRLEQRRCLKVLSFCLWKKLVLLKTEQVSDRDESSCADASATCRQHGRTCRSGFRSEGGQARQSQ